jgi:D-beta-D-heptose 7-phosphate kinase/D-beta-D-heptose 1-phosphate adenosyltransferase
MKNYNKILKEFTGKHVLVIGDLIVDQYVKGQVDRISPEAPVPIVLQEHMFFTPGGAANVANNLSSLGARVTLAGLIGPDQEGKLLKGLLAERNICTEGVFVDKKGVTTLKTRVFAHQQQVVRIDRERIFEDPQDVFYKASVAPFLRKNFSGFSAVVVSDYGKGMVQARLMEDVSLLANKAGIPLVVDPKVEHLKYYGQVTAITPNRKETENALKALEPETRKAFGITTTRLGSLEAVKSAASGLLKYLGIESLLVTLGEDGMCLFEKGRAPLHIPTRAREVFDVSGAGDSVISVFALALASGADKKAAADIANHAAGIVVGKIGAASATQEELAASLKDH